MTNCVEVYLLMSPDEGSLVLIPGRLMKQVNRKRQITLTLYLYHYPVRHGMPPAPGIEARAALGCRHPPVEREGNPPRNVYHLSSNCRAG